MATSVTVVSGNKRVTSQASWSVTLTFSTAADMENGRTSDVDHMLSELLTKLRAAGYTVNAVVTSGANTKGV